MRTSFLIPQILVAYAAGATAAPPTEWIEPATGHRVVRLSRDDGTSKLYFHQNAFTLSGDKLVVSTPAGLASIDLKTAPDDAAGGRPRLQCGRRQEESQSVLLPR